MFWVENGWSLIAEVNWSKIEFIVLLFFFRNKNILSVTECGLNFVNLFQEYFLNL